MLLLNDVRDPQTLLVVAEKVFLLHHLSKKMNKEEEEGESGSSSRGGTRSLDELKKLTMRSIIITRSKHETRRLHLRFVSSSRGVLSNECTGQQSWR